MRRAIEYVSIRIVTRPGVNRNSIGYGWFMLPGTPGGMQFATCETKLMPARPLLASWNAANFFAYSGVNCGRLGGGGGGGGVALPAVAPAAPAGGVGGRAASGRLHATEVGEVRELRVLVVPGRRGAVRRALRVGLVGALAGASTDRRRYQQRCRQRDGSVCSLILFPLSSPFEQSRREHSCRGPRDAQRRWFVIAHRIFLRAARRSRASLYDVAAT